jgi:benzoyl-CoA reductase subunit C
MQQTKEKIGFTCAYTPLALLDAAGYAPYRILPMGDQPDQAGRVLHDNLCPHVKRVLDRAMSDDLPDLAGIVLMNSCDTMRRLADAWRKVRPTDRVILVDLPVLCDNASAFFFAKELGRLRDTLSEWTGLTVEPEAIERSMQRYEDLSDLLTTMGNRLMAGTLNGSAREAQDLYNRAATEPIEETIERVRSVLAGPETSPESADGVPVYLFGNVLPDPDAFSLLEECGIRIAGEDLCTGSRLFAHIDSSGSHDVLTGLARGLLSRPACARTFNPKKPGTLAEDVVERAKQCGARGVIGHTVKFCDPYLARLPVVRDALRKAGIPVLILEGDCTLRSLGQQKTRIEAFAEMLR